jgi:multidrug efflux pump subunit AcrA (membrane-fusion protein)
MSERPDSPQDDPESLPEGDEAPPPGVRMMALLRWTLVGLMALAAAGAVVHSLGLFSGGADSAAATVYYCPMHPGIQQDRPGECPICGMTLVLRESSGQGAAAKAPVGAAAEVSHAGHRHEPSDPYQCSMDPEETGPDAEARCPLCGMKMTPKAATPPAAPPGLVPVTITPERIQLIGMRTAKVTREPLLPQLRTVGFVTTNERKLARIQTRFSGWIEQLHVDQTGQRVSRGQALAAIYSPELLTVQQEFLSARRWSEQPAGEAHHAKALTGSLFEDARKKLELYGISPDEIDEIARTGQPMRALRIRSPADGYVTQKSAVQGLYVQPGTPLFEIADLSSIWVLADVYEYEIGRVREGQKARFAVASYPGETFEGRVQFVYPTVDTASRTLRLRLELKNPGLRLRPGMYGDVALDLDAAEGLAVPREAVVDTGESQYVFVDRGGGRFEPRIVKTGMRSGDQVQILDGVSEGETVVTTGNFLIDSESRLAATIQGR